MADTENKQAPKPEKIEAVEGKVAGSKPAAAPSTTEKPQLTQAAVKGKSFGKYQQEKKGES